MKVKVVAVTSNSIRIEKICKDRTEALMFLDSLRQGRKLEFTSVEDIQEPDLTGYQ